MNEYIFKYILSKSEAILKVRYTFHRITYQKVPPFLKKT